MSTLGEQTAESTTAAAVDEGLQVEGISVSFGGISALQDVSLRVRTGEIVGVIGPNGAGKTTLFNAICGFVKPDSGDVRWRAHSLCGIAPHRLASLGVARTLQGVGLFGRLTVLENVMVGAEPRHKAGFLSTLLGLPRADRDEGALRDAALAALERAGVAQFAQRLPGTLPYPVQKRVSLARALVAEPALLLLDEPASGLGGDDLRSLSKLIDKLRGSMAVMLVEHHMDFVSALCDRIVVLDFGRVIATGTAFAIQNDRRVLEAYLGFDTHDTAALSGPSESGGGEAEDA